MEPEATIPIFPLANVVLFPKLHIPLYIFEPRYRHMTQVALDGDRRIGMTVVVPDQRQEPGTDPDVFDIGCEGLIDHVRRRPDGTFDLLLVGTHRFRIERELPRPSETLFRTTEIVYLLDEAEEQSPAELANLKSEVQDKYRELLKRHAPQHLAQFESESIQALPHDVVANTLAVSMDCDAMEKQSLLEAASTSLRLRGLITILEFQLAQRANTGTRDLDSIQ